MTTLDQIRARTDAATKRLAAWDNRPERVSFRDFSAVDNGAIRVRTLHLSCESALLASAENAKETIPKLIAALRAVEAVHQEMRRTTMIGPYCTHCISPIDGGPELWPCKTLAAIREALG